MAHGAKFISTFFNMERVKIFSNKMVYLLSKSNTFMVILNLHYNNQLIIISNCKIVSLIWFQNADQILIFEAGKKSMNFSLRET
jgi:hypothetical protein